MRGALEEAPAEGELRTRATGQPWRFQRLEAIVFGILTNTLRGPSHTATAVECQRRLKMSHLWRLKMSHFWGR